jgi:sorting nexin-29
MSSVTTSVGFRRGISASDQIFNLCQVLEECNEFGIETRHLFLDFRAAYGIIGRSNLYDAMEEFHIPKKLNCPS